MERTLTSKLLHDLVIGNEPNTKTRKRACIVTRQMAEFARIKYDPTRYAGNYSPDSVDPRTIPTDSTIVEYWEKLSNPGWKWVFGILATYGLRPHEAFRLDLEVLRAGDSIIQVQKNTKTGYRQVWAYHPEWFEAFHLSSIHLPPIQLDRPNSAIGRSASHYFRDFGFPFRLMDLRHRWAIRTLEYGLDYQVAARMMGHGYQVHERIYHRWIDRKVLQSAYDRSLMNHQNPPLPNSPG
ncbi:hypothetical protein ACQ4M3_40780 [Leptolyngbya sp. AN03gr2]|uniref:hypothetical protein n=1 Tax=unclassified Leptolyngbya TaxID=2650499 RepID=UPI003D30FCB6